MDSGFMALSIYCAEMASKWGCVLDYRPTQGRDMSVQVYYDQFFIWKKKLEEVNYIGDEESYIDDFLFGLKMDLALRVWGYKWKPRTLYGAFRRAEIEETMISWKELSRENDVDKVFEEMSQPNSINIADTIKAEGVPDEKSNGVRKLLDSEEVTENEITSEQEDSGPGDSQNEEDDFLHFKADNPLVEMVGQSFPSKPEVVADAHHMVDEMLRPVLVSLNSDASLFRDEGNEYLSSVIKGLQTGWKLFDVMPKRISAELNEEMYAIQDYTSPFGYVPQIFDTGSSFLIDDGVLLSFDPGGSFWFHNGCDFFEFIDGLGYRPCLQFSREYGKVSSGRHPIIALIIDNIAHGDDFTEMDLKALFEKANFGLLMTMLSFDPGGCSLSQMGIDPFDFNGEKGEFHLTVVDTVIKAIKHKCKDVILLIVNVVMFYFDPGGCHLPQMGCDLFEFNVEQRDYCLATIMVDTSVKAIIHTLRIMISSVCGIKALVGRAFFRIGLYTFVETGTGKMSYYVDDIIVSYPIVVLYKKDVDGSSCVKLITSWCAYILRDGGSEKLCGEATDETPENAVKLFVYIYDKQGSGRSMSKMKGMVKQLAMMQPCNELDVSAKFQLISEHMPKISSSYLEEAVQLFGDQGHEHVQEALLHIEDKEDSDSMSNVCLDVAMIGFVLGDGSELWNWIQSLANWDYLLKSMWLCITFTYIICRGWMGYDFAILLVSLALIIVGEFQRLKFIITTEVHDYFLMSICKEMHSVVVKCIFKKLEAWDIYMLKQRICFYPFGILCQCNEFCKTSGAQEFKAIASRDFYAKWIPAFFYCTTLRTRRLLRGWICHVPRLKIRKKTEDALLAVNNVICDVTTLCRISIIRVFDLLPKS